MQEKPRRISIFGGKSGRLLWHQSELLRSWWIGKKRRRVAHSDGSTLDLYLAGIPPMTQGDVFAYLLGKHDYTSQCLSKHKTDDGYLCTLTITLKTLNYVRSLGRQISVIWGQRWSRKSARQQQDTKRGFCAKETDHHCIAKQTVYNICFYCSFLYWA